jgi:hypothetical protein
LQSRRFRYGKGSESNTLRAVLLWIYLRVHKQFRWAHDVFFYQEMVNNVRYKTFMCGKLDIERDRKLQYMIDKKTTDFIWKLTLGLEFSNCIYSLQKSFLRYLKFYCYDADGINNWNQGAFPCS